MDLHIILSQIQTFSNLDHVLLDLYLCLSRLCFTVKVDLHILLPQMGLIYCKNLFALLFIRSLVRFWHSGSGLDTPIMVIKATMVVDIIPTVRDGGSDR